MALDFDGTNDQVDHGDIALLDAMTAGTWMFWYNIDAVKLQGYLSKASGAAAGWAVTSGVGSNNDVSWRSANQSGRILNASEAGDIGVWHHVAFVFDGAGVGNSNRLKGWLDGASQVLTFAGTIPANTGADIATTVKNGSIDGASFLDGRLAAVKIWNAILTEAEIQAEQFSYLPVRRADLVMDVPYDDGVQARDYSGSNNHGTVTEAVQAAGPPNLIYGPRVILPMGRRSSQGRRQPSLLIPVRAWYNTR